MADQVGFPVEGLGALVAFVLPLLGVDHHVLLQAWEERHGCVWGDCRARPAPRSAPHGAATHRDTGGAAAGSRWGTESCSHAHRSGIRFMDGKHPLCLKKLTGLVTFHKGR